MHHRSDPHKKPLILIHPELLQFSKGIQRSTQGRALTTTLVVALLPIRLSLLPLVFSTRNPHTAALQIGHLGWRNHYSVLTEAEQPRLGGTPASLGRKGSISPDSPGSSNPGMEKGLWTVSAAPGRAVCALRTQWKA